MMVTPAFFGHLITIMSGLANGKQAVCLEGGYYIPSLAEGVVMTFRALLNDACAELPPMKMPKASVIDTINSLKFFLRCIWKCFSVSEVTLKSGVPKENVHIINIPYLGAIKNPPFPTKETSLLITKERLEKFEGIMKDLLRSK